MKQNQFLTEKYPDLPGSKPVEGAVAKKVRQGEKGPQTKEARVEAYLERLERLISSGSHVSDERGWELLKHKIIKEFSIDTDDHDTLAKIAHGLYESEKKLAIDQGRGAEIAGLEGDSGLIEKYKGLVKEKRDIQERTLTDWLDYLKQNDAEYPMWFRYFVVRNLQKMGTIDKEKGEYAKRTQYTVAPFPELNSEALGFVYRAFTEGIGKDEFAAPADAKKREKLQNIIAKKDFAKLYTFAQVETAGRLNRETIQGHWVKYNQGSNHHTLENALRNKGTGWCTAEGSAYPHLQGGDFYVYYTKGLTGDFTEPRVAIRMEGDHVGEVRGVNARQELEPELVDIATQKYHSLPGGEKFDKKSADMKKVTELTKKQEKEELFTKDDLVFLYEIESPIQGFGYQKDPRIQELLKSRNPKADAPIVLECQPNEIAWSRDQINKNTKAYIGPLFPNIFKTLKHLEHLYTSFPEGKITRLTTEIGGQTTQELAVELKQNKIEVSKYAQSMMQNKDFTTQKNAENIDLIRLKVRDLGFPPGKYPTIDEIYAKAKELGLELCPPEVGPHLRLNYQDQPLGEWFYVGMEPISDSAGYPLVFYLERIEGGLWLYDDWTNPRDEWAPEDSFVFRLRKLNS